MLKILRPGLQTTIQDAGRFGWYHIGMPPSGAMDQFSFRAGNLLAGNHEGAAAQRRACADVGRARAESG
jgi:allophanate hydrolase subunit 2